MSLLIGVDVGTTNIKAVLYDSQAGATIAVSTRANVGHHPRLEWTEFDPDEMWQAVAAAVREVVAGWPADQIAAIAVASMGEAGVPLDAGGGYLYPIIAWHDPRTEPFVGWWTEHINLAELYQITGLAPRHIYGINKLLWLRKYRPDVFHRIARWLSVEDFILWKLTGRYATDYSIASRTMAFDQQGRRWSAKLLDVADISGNIWPEALPSGCVVGGLLSVVAEELRLQPPTLAVTGGHDHLCGALAAGLLKEGEVLDSTGTAQAVLGIANEFHPTDRLRKAGLSYYHYVASDRYVLQAGLSAAGGALAWLVSILGGDYDLLLADAADSPPGSRGVLWLPHLLGSGSPDNDPKSRGAALGMTATTTRGDVVRALLEALSYSLRQNVEMLEVELGKKLPEVIAIGGATRSALWRQLKADVTGRPVRLPGIAEATAVGAALLAGLGAGVFRDEAEAVASISAPSLLQVPDPSNAALYTDLYHDLYLPLYGTLVGLSHRMARFSDDVS